MKRLFVALLSVGLLTAACSDTSEVSQVELDPTDIQLVNRLIPFDDCENVLDHIKEEATERVGPYGLDNSGSPAWIIDPFDGVLRSEVAVLESGPDVAMAVGESAAFDSDASSSSSGSSGEISFTGTNVQELGVDEPDIIKTDGERILVINRGLLSHF
ncbi:MAG: beta-propeller domain-containing protein, partial [Actinomycetota bacterium]|nr:beta-propeller domain-containing protein [Actinomycetota bacterium]